MKKQNGFTIVELIVAIAGVGVIAAIGWMIYVVIHFINKFW